MAHLRRLTLFASSKGFITFGRLVLCRRYCESERSERAVSRLSPADLERFQLFPPLSAVTMLSLPLVFVVLTLRYAKLLFTPQELSHHEVLVSTLGIRLINAMRCIASAPRPHSYLQLARGQPEVGTWLSRATALSLSCRALLSVLCWF